MSTSYVTLAEATSAIDAAPSTPAATTAAIEQAIAAASRDVDAHCQRRFHADTDATARVFVAEACDYVEVDDFHTTDGLVVSTDDAMDGTFSTTWSLDDLQLDPPNGVSGGLEGWPTTGLIVLSGSFPGVRRRALVKVTAKWGWAAVPDAVRSATLAQFSTVYMAPKATFGVAGISEIGAPVAIRPLHPVAARLLARYVKTPVAVA